MAVTVTDPDELGGDELAACKIVTVDATGTEREYRVGLTDQLMGDGDQFGALMAGKRIDEHDFDRKTPDGPSTTAWNAARDHFESMGFDVFGDRR